MAAPSPGTAFPQGDPRNALYFETVGKLEHQRDQTKTENERLLGTERGNATYKQGQLTQQEPLTYGANRSRAVREGIASSGVNSERRGGIATSYANRRFAITKGLTEREGQLQRSNKAAEDRYSEGVTSAGTRAQIQAQEQLERNPPAVGPYAPAGTPQIPAGSQPPPGMEFNNGLTVPIGTRTIRPYAEKRTRR